MDPVCGYRVRVDSVGVGSSAGTTSVSGACERYVIHQSNSVTPQTDLVLFTFGGNDNGFSNIVMKCFTVALRSVGGCRDSLTTARDGLDDTMNNVKTLLLKMATNPDPAHRLRPDAKIAYVSYPLLELNDDFKPSKLFGSVDAGRQVRELGLLARDKQIEVVNAVNAELGRTDTNGKVLASSTEIGSRSDKVRVTVSAGTYLLRVTAKAGEPGGSYNLNATRIGK